MLAGSAAITVYGNTIWGNGTIGSGYCAGNVYFASDVSPQGSVTFENNIVGQGGQYEFDRPYGSYLVSNYNDFYHSTGGTFMKLFGTAYNFSGWKTASGQDANSQNADPQFMNASATQFWLQSGSPAIDAGTNLGSPYNIALLPSSSWLRGLETHVAGQAALISDYATARHGEEPILTAPTESTVQWLLHRRMGANEQMRWSPRGAHLMLKVRTAVTNGTFDRDHAAAERWARRPFRQAA